MQYYPVLLLHVKGLALDSWRSSRVKECWTRQCPGNTTQAACAHCYALIFFMWVRYSGLENSHQVCKVGHFVNAVMCTS